MKKSVKKLAALMMAVSLSMSMAVPGYAGSITITANGDHTTKGTFQAHKILNLSTANGYTVKYEKHDGDTVEKYYVYEDDGATPVLLEDGKHATSDDINIKGTYTVNPVYKDILTAAIAALEGGTITDEVAIIQYITGHVKPDGTTLEDGEVTARAFADAVRIAILAANLDESDYETQTGAGGADITFTGLDHGYWLVIQETTGEGSASSLCILDNVAEDAVIKVKAEAPSVEKKVADDDYNNGEYNDIAAWDIGDMVPFKFESTVVDISEYDVYKYVFHDEVTKGLTFDASKANVKVILMRGSDNYDITDLATIAASDDVSGDYNGFNITLADLLKLDDAVNTIPGNKAMKDDKIIVTFELLLNEDAVVGVNGNFNEVWLEYTNTPYASTEPGDTPTSETPKDKVVVFTFGLDIDKVNDDETPIKLEGAMFDLYAADVNDSSTAGIKINVKAVNAAGEALFYNSADNKYYTDSAFSTAATVDHFVVDPTKTPSDPIISTLDNNIIVHGLDEGTYYLRETKAPEGYNPLDNDIKIVITPTFDNDGNAETDPDRNAWTSGVASDALVALSAIVGNTTIDGDLKETGLVPVQVINNRGGLLPGTGGIGTTVFYVGGLVLMITAAGYFVISKKRKYN